MKGKDFVRVVPDQMHQLQVAKVETVAFRPQRSAIGLIGYNEDASTIVLTPFSGRVTRLIARLGDLVKKGDPLLEIDSPEQLVPQNDFIAAQATKRKAGSQHNLAVIAEKRVRDLHEGKAAPAKELQQAEAQLSGAEHDLRSAEMAFEAARVRLRILGRTEAEISKLEQDGMLNRVTTITAPISGTVVSRKVGPGQYVKADSGEALYTIADLSTVWLKAQIFEQDIAQVQIGQEIEAKVSAVPNRVFKARINAINPASDLTTRRVVVRAEIENADHLLKSEMFAMFKISIGEASRSPGGADGRGYPRGRHGHRLDRDRAAAVQAPRGRDRHAAGRFDANPQRSRCRRKSARARGDLRRQRVASMILRFGVMDAA